MLGGVLGLVISVGIILLAVLLDNKIHTEDDIAKYLDLTKKFYRETGQRMTDYINHAKIQYACVQLTGTDKTLQQISEELHYSSRSYFTAVFRKVIGCSPTEYRNNGGNKP